MELIPFNAVFKKFGFDETKDRQLVELLFANIAVEVEGEKFIKADQIPQLLKSVGLGHLLKKKKGSQKGKTSRQLLVAQLTNARKNVVLHEKHVINHKLAEANQTDPVKKREITIKRLRSENAAKAARTKVAFLEPIVKQEQDSLIESLQDRKEG